MIGSGGVMVEGCDDEVRLRDDITCLARTRCQFIFFKGRSKLYATRCAREKGQNAGGADGRCKIFP